VYFQALFYVLVFKDFWSSDKMPANVLIMSNLRALKGALNATRHWMSAAEACPQKK